MDRSNFTAELGQHRNNTVAAPGFSGPNPITRPFDTETDTDPDSANTDQLPVPGLSGPRMPKCARLAVRISVPLKDPLTVSSGDPGVRSLLTV